MVWLREATTADLPDLHRVWWATRPEHEPRPNPWFAHVLRTGRILIALSDQIVVGFAGYRSLEGTGVVSDCFVAPDHQGRGIGSALLDHLLPAGTELATLASDHQLAEPLYRRFGMAPIGDCSYLVGRPPPQAAPALAVEAVDFYPVAPFDLPHLADDLGCTFLSVGCHKSCAAVTTRSVESSWVAPEDDPASVLTSVLSYLAAAGSTKVEIQISPAHAAFPMLRASGFEIKLSDTLMATPDARPTDHTRATFNGDLLDLPHPQLA